MDTLDQVRWSKHLWDEWKYRHEMFHKTLVRWAWTIVGFAVLPWIKTEFFERIGPSGWRFYVGYWIILVLLLCGTNLHLACEYAHLQSVDRKLRELRGGNSPFDLSLQYELWHAFSPRLVRIATCIYIGSLIFFSLWVGLLYHQKSGATDHNAAAQLATSGSSQGTTTKPPTQRPTEAEVPPKHPSEYGAAPRPASLDAKSPPPSSMDVFDGCGLDGNTKTVNLKKLNQLKNRYTVPKDDQIDHSITLSALLAPGDDKTRWNSTSGAEITGFVLDVKPGGKETCNCSKTDPVHTDTHIELVLNSTDTLGTQSVVVEVTPRLRAIMEADGTDWSTKTLRTQYRHKWAKVSGWMAFDSQHANAAENTNPGGANNWRASAWEIHPVTDIQVIRTPQ